MSSLGGSLNSSLNMMHSLADNHKSSMLEPAVDPQKRAEAIASGRIPYRELQHLYEETADKLRRVANEKEEIAMLAQQRQEAFLRTEEKYRDDMRLLEVRLQKMGQEDRSRMDPLRNVHEQVLDTISSIQNKTARVLQDQERDLIRAFRARLADVTVELENERKKNESGSAEWVARCRKLTEELEWLRDLTDKLTSENKSVLKDNRRFRRQMKTQEEDREFLIKQLVSVKKENARLRYSFDQLMAGNVGAVNLSPEAGAPAALQAGGQGSTVSAITGQPMSGTRPALRAGTPVTDAHGNRAGSTTPFGGSMHHRHSLPSRPQSALVQPSGGFRNGPTPGSSRPATALAYASTTSLGSVGGGGSMDEDKEQRYKAMVAKLQRQLEDAQKSLRNLRTSYTAELSSRTELQNFVKKCIDDVRQDMAERGRSASMRRAQGAHRANSAGAVRSRQPLPPPLDPRSIPLSDFTPQDRISVLEWLMSQDSVIFMLYDKIFPQRNANAQQQQQQQQQQQSSDAQSSHGQGDFSSPIHAGAPGSLFYSPQQYHRPSTSPGQSSAAYAGSVKNTQMRPQTGGGAHSRTSGTGTASSLPSMGGSGLSSPHSSSGRSIGGQASQYEKPLGTRPLSGFDAMRGNPDGTGAATPHLQAQRPHTAAAGAVAQQPASAHSNSSEWSSSRFGHPSSSSGGLSAEEREEDAYQRQQRALAMQRDDDEEDDAQRREEEYDDQDANRSGLGALDPLSDEDDEQQQQQQQE